MLSGVLSGISSGILSGRWGPVVLTELGRSQAEVQRCSLSSEGPRLRSSGAHSYRTPAVEVQQCPLHAEVGEELARRTAVEVQQCPLHVEVGEELARRKWAWKWMQRWWRRSWRRGRRRRRRRTTVIKSNTLTWQVRKKEPNNNFFVRWLICEVLTSRIANGGISEVALGHLAPSVQSPFGGSVTKKSLLCERLSRHKTDGPVQEVFSAYRGRP